MFSLFPTSFYYIPLTPVSHNAEDKNKSHDCSSHRRDYNDEGAIWVVEREGREERREERRGGEKRGREREEEERGGVIQWWMVRR